MKPQLLPPPRPNRSGRTALISGLGTRDHNRAVWRLALRCVGVASGLFLAVVAAVALASDGASAQSAVPSHDLWAGMDAGARAMAPRVRTMTIRICAGLMTLEFLVTVFFMMIRSVTTEQMVLGIVYKGGLLLLLFSMVSNTSSFLGPSFNFLLESGGYVANMPGGPNPWGIAQAGNLLFWECLEAASIGFTLESLNRFLIMFFVACMLWLLAQLVAVLVMVALIESVIVIYGGSLFLGFAMSRFTAGLADNYFAYAMGVGVKVFFLYVILGIASGSTGGWLTTIQSVDQYEEFYKVYDICAAAMVFALTALYVPQAAASKITSGFAVGFQRAHQSLY